MSGNKLGWVKPGFTNSSNDNTRPTGLFNFRLGDGDAFDVDVVDVVGEAVVVSFTLAGAAALVADFS